MAAVATSEEFTEASEGLSKHLFPDGCPDQNLESLWPHYDRTPTAFTDAINSYEQVVNLSLRKGLSSLQTHAMIVTVLSMLPQSKYKGPFATCTYFDKTLQAIIPCEMIPICAVERLISGVTASEKGRCSVLQYLYLAVSYGCIELEYLEKRYYSFLIHWSIQTETCNDSVRLLLLMSPQPRYTRRLLHHKERPGLSSLSLLLQLYTGVATDTRLGFLNREWEKSFQRFHKPVPFVNISLSDLDHSWKAYQLSKVAGIKPSTAHCRSVLMDRWFQGDILAQKKLLEKLAFLPLMDDFLVQRVLPLWDGRDADLLMHALPLKLQVLPFLERHFVFGSPGAQYAIGEYWMRFVEEGSDSVSEVVLFANDLLLRTLFVNFNPVVVFIALDFLDRCTISPGPALFYFLALSGVSWERVCKLITRYKNEKWIDDQVLEEMISDIRQVLSGGPNLEDLCHRKSVKERLAVITRRNNRNAGDLKSGTCLPGLAEVIQSDWPDAHQFLGNIS